MGYLEEPIAFCPHCRIDIPYRCFWRGRGTVISRNRQRRTHVLHSRCPECGHTNGLALRGPAIWILLYSWIWRLRYPAVSPPARTRPRRCQVEWEPEEQRLAG